MTSEGAGPPRAAVTEISARARASRINGAKSRGPKTEAGKARSAGNALKHGFRSQRFVVLADEDASEFEAFAAALMDELAPRGALQEMLAGRIAAAAWRLLRSDRIEAELFEQQGNGDGDLGLALIRDGNGARAFPTLLRYRGAAQAEFWRALRTLKALQAEAVEAESSPVDEIRPDPVPVLVFEPKRTRGGTRHMPDLSAREPQPVRRPNKPETCRNPGRAPLPAPAPLPTSSLARGGRILE
jgi:hypothetical protein